LSGRPGDQLALEYLRSQCGSLFRRGFQLTAHRQQLYVRTTGTKVPLRLDLTASWQQVQQRCGQLQELLQQGGYDPCAWDGVLGQPGTRRNQGKMPSRAEVIETWRRRKLAEGCAERTFRYSYESILLRLDERQPLRDHSVLAVIESVPATSPRRSRVVRMLRQISLAFGVPWNGHLLDPLQGSWRVLPKRGTPFFTDAEIEQLVLALREAGKLEWWRLTATLAIYGLRPWEAWIARPDARPDCLLVPRGKKNSTGTSPPRVVPPFHREWLELFDFQEALRQPLPKPHVSSSVGGMVTKYLRYNGFLLDPGPDRARHSSYGFRHAYARRMHSPRYRVTDTHGALFMGHTVSVHNTAYRRWILGTEDALEAYGFTIPGGE
jgi:integrase